MQDALLDAVEAAIAALAEASKALFPVLIVGAPLRHNGAALQQRRRDPSRPDPGRGPQDLPAELPRVLREAPVRARRRRARRDDRGWPARRSRSAPTCCSARRRHRRLHLPRRDLRGRLGADPALQPRARWPAPRCCSTSRPPTSPSARPTSAACSAPRQSARCIAAYVYTAAGPGESTTDLAWDGQADDLRERRAAGRRRALRRRLS